MSDKLPTLYVVLSSGGRAGSVAHATQKPDSAERVAEVERACGHTVQTGVYEPAVPRCKTCPRLNNSGLEFNVGNGAISECEFLSCLDNPDMKLPQDGSGYCSNHPEAKP